MNLASIRELRADATTAKEVDVYMFAGQSNMWGTGTHIEQLPPELQGPQKDVLIYAGFPSVPKEGWYPLENGKNDNWDGGGAWGCEAELAHELAAAAVNKPIYIYKNSAAGSALEVKANEKDWNPQSKGELLDGFLDGLAKVKSSLEGLGLKPNFRGFIWMQGEADSQTKTGSDNYQANFEAMVARIREAAGAPDMPVYMGRVHTHYAAPFLQQERAAEARIAAAGHNIFMFDTDASPLQSDSIHFNPAGQVANGKAIFDLISGKTKPAPCKIAPNQVFTIREFSGPGTPVGTIALSEPGLPTPTYVVEGDYLEVDGETGKMKVKDLASVDYTKGPLKIKVETPNGVVPTASETITIQFQHDDDKAPIVGTYGVFDPSVASDSTVTGGGYDEIHDATDTTHKYTAADPSHRPLQDVFPGTTKNGLKFDGTKIMLGPASNEFIKAGVDEDFTMALAVSIPVHSLTGRGWLAAINKASPEAGLGIGFDYAKNEFFYTCSNPFNGASEEIYATQATTPGTSHVVRMRKVGSTCRLFIDGVLAAENKEPVRAAILSEGQGAPIGLGGLFPPAPSFTGSIGKIYLIKAIPTTSEEARIDKDLAAWVGAKP